MSRRRNGRFAICVVGRSRSVCSDTLYKMSNKGMTSNLVTLGLSNILNGLQEFNYLGSDEDLNIRIDLVTRSKKTTTIPQVSK